MAFYAKDEYIGDGSNDVFNITFPYLNRDLIKVYINDVEDPAITFLTDTQIKTSVVPEDGAIVQLARNTPLDRRVDFKNASLLDSQILDEDSMQTMHIVQEAYDGLENTMGRGTANDWDAEGLPISHVGDPVDPDDAMNMRSAMSYLEATEDARDQAVVARSEAESAETGAEKWAEENEDVEVEPNQYSAFHWAKKAQAEAGSVIGMQVHDNTWHSEDFETTTKLPDNAGAHNSIYRGEYLGSEVTTEQYNAISNGNFEDLYIGDYWTIGGVNYRIAAFNYHYNDGDTALTNNHVTLVPDDNLYTHVMNDTDTTDGGYINSKMYIEGLDSAKTTINSAFGSHVVNHRKYLCNAVSSGEQSGGSWYDSEVELMNEVMVYGSVVNGGAANGLYNIGAEKTQLPLFALRPDIANIQSAYWLRDVVSGTNFANVNSSGYANRNLASYALGVRPAFSIS